MLNVWDLMRLAVRHWLMVGSLVVGGGVLALIVALLMAPRYRSETILSVRTEDMSQSALSAIAGQFGTLAQMAGLSSGGTTIDQAVAVLQSSGLAQDFIQKFELVDDLSADAHKQLSLPRAVKYFKRSVLSVRRDKATGLITVSILWTDAERAAQWVNAYVQMADALMRERTLGDTGRSLALLREELGKNQEVAIRAAVANLVEAEMKRSVFARTKTEFVLQVLDQAQASDPRDNVSPRRAWIVLAGLIAGGLLALCILVVRVGMLEQLAGDSA